MQVVPGHVPEDVCQILFSLDQSNDDGCEWCSGRERPSRVRLMSIVSTLARKCVRDAPVVPVNETYMSRLFRTMSLPWRILTRCTK